MGTVEFFKEKWAALNALTSEFAGCEMRMHTDMMFSVAIAGRAEIGNKHMLTSLCGRGNTPEAAIDDLWRQATNLKDDEFIVINASDRSKRRQVRWNGFMWADVPALSGGAA